MPHETSVLANLLKKARPILETVHHGVLFKHADAMTTGIPDLSYTLSGRTSWWEAKVAMPKVRGVALQHFIMQRLAKAGLAWYIVYEEVHGVRRVCLLRPAEIDEHGYFICPSERQCKRWNHEFVINFMLQVHTP